MAFIGLEVSPDLTEILANIKVSGKKENPFQYHVTLVYLNEIDLEHVIPFLLPVFEVCCETEPFEVECDYLGTFSTNEDGTPIIVRLKSQNLMKFRERMVKEIKKAGLEFNNKYPEFKPHITLSYDPEDEEKVKKNLPKLPKGSKWTINRVVLWAGEYEDGTEQIKFSFPLGVKDTSEKTAALSRLFLKLAESGL